MNVSTKITIEMEPRTIWVSFNFSTSSFSGAVLNPINAIMAAQKNQPGQKYPNGNNPAKKIFQLRYACLEQLHK